MKPTIFIDNKIPFIKGVLDKKAKVEYLSPDEMNAKTIQKADALIVRTRTKCNKDLLENSSVKCIATATIGFDHIDTKYCKEKNIFWTNAEGCNSGSVMQYIASVLCHLSKKQEFDLRAKTIGIVGVGNVGKNVEKLCKLLGMNVLLCDPPRSRNENSNQFVSLETIQQQCDIITFHTPLNKTGEDKTFHLADNKFFESLKRKPIIINSSRGEIIDTKAVKKAIQNELISGCVLDVWENEPNIDTELLDLVDIATPHIAGYSADGKANGTTMSVQAVSKFLTLGLDDWAVTDIPQPDKNEIVIDTEMPFSESIQFAMEHTYKVIEDNDRLRKSVSTFEKQRSEYPLRREFHAWKVKTSFPGLIKTLKDLGFKE